MLIEHELDPARGLRSWLIVRIDNQRVCIEGYRAQQNSEFQYDVKARNQAGEIIRTKSLMPLFESEQMSRLQQSIKSSPVS
jgi:hypothetical protein